MNRLYLFPLLVLGVCFFLAVGYVFFTDPLSKNNTVKNKPALSVEKQQVNKKLGSIDMNIEYPRKEHTALINPFDSSNENTSKLMDPTKSEVNISQFVVKDKVAIDVNDNKIASPLSSGEKGNLGTDNEFGEGVAVEFHPGDSKQGEQLSIDNEFGEGVVTEFNPGDTNQGEQLSIDNEFGEGVVAEFDPARNQNQNEGNTLFPK